MPSVLAELQTSTISYLWKSYYGAEAVLVQYISWGLKKKGVYKLATMSVYMRDET
jgi:hypothetical protein